MTAHIDNPVAHEPLVRIPDRMWIGNDVKLAADCTVPQGQTTIPIYNPPGSTYPVGLSRNPEAESDFCIRSRIAQMGGNSIAFGRNYKGENSSFMIFQNFGNLPIHFNKDDGIGCRFDFSGGDWVTGRELMERAFDNNGLRIEGDYGNEWFLHDVKRGVLIPKKDEIRMHDAYGIALRLKSKRWKIRTSEEPINIGSVGNYREFLNTKVFEELPLGEHYPFWIGETRAVVHLGEGFNGILNVAGHVGRHDFFQTRSTLMQGGNGRTSWPIRTEFIDTGTNSKREPVMTDAAYDHVYLLMSLYRDKRLGTQATLAV